MTGDGGSDLFRDEQARTNERAQQLVGMDLDAATALTAEWGYQFRVTREDQESFILTMDLSSRRINVEVEHGLIVTTAAF